MMCARSVWRFAVVVVCGATAAVGLLAGVSAQTAGTPERYNATAMNMGSGPGMAGRVLVAVDRWSTAQERQKLLTVFREKGPEKLLDALQDNPKVGYIRLPNTRIDYPFTLIEIRFDKNGVGVGKMSVYTKISLSKDKQTVELENFDIEPVRLTEVRIEK